MTALEQTAFTLILHSGDARSACMEAIQYAKQQDFVKAEQLLEQATEEIGKAHEAQTGLIQKESQGNRSDITLLLIHAQDHLMNSITVKDLAREFVELYKRLNE